MRKKLVFGMLLCCGLLFGCTSIENSENADNTNAQEVASITDATSIVETSNDSADEVASTDAASTEATTSERIKIELCDIKKDNSVVTSFEGIISYNEKIYVSDYMYECLKLSDELPINRKYHEALGDCCVYGMLIKDGFIYYLIDDGNQEYIAAPNDPSPRVQLMDEFNLEGH